MPLAVEIPKSQTEIVFPLPRWESRGPISRKEKAVGFQWGIPDAAQKGYPPRSFLAEAGESPDVLARILGLRPEPSAAGGAQASGPRLDNMMPAAF